MQRAPADVELSPACRAFGFDPHGGDLRETGPNEIVARFRDTSTNGNTSTPAPARMPFSTSLRYGPRDSSSRAITGAIPIPVNQIVAATDHSQFTMYHRGRIVPREDATFSLSAGSTSFFGGR